MFIICLFFTDHIWRTSYWCFAISGAWWPFLEDYSSRPRFLKFCRPGENIHCINFPIYQALWLKVPITSRTFPTLFLLHCVVLIEFTMHSLWKTQKVVILWSITEQWRGMCWRHKLLCVTVFKKLCQYQPRTQALSLSLDDKGGEEREPGFEVVPIQSSLWRQPDIEPIPLPCSAMDQSVTTLYFGRFRRVNKVETFVELTEAHILKTSQPGESIVGFWKFSLTREGILKDTCLCNPLGPIKFSEFCRYTIA